MTQDQAKTATPSPASSPEEPQEETTWAEVPPEDDGSMGLVDHLEELRTRILRSLAFIFLGALGCYSISDRILELITRTAPAGQQFIFLSPTEAFFTHLTVSAYGGLLMAAPFLIHQVWAFLRPGLTRRERHYSTLLFPVITFFFFTGAAFAYAVILPLGINFLLGFATEALRPMLSISSYSTFVLTFLLVFGGAFELPVVIFMAARMGLVSRDDLRVFRPHFVVALVTVSAVLTPPDVVTQLLLAFPIWILYEATILLLGIL
jgi:sec-independent protein translocase protein TatC